MAKVFISSTTEDLRDHRAAVIRALLDRRHEPVLLESISADAYRAPLDESFRLIDSCDLFIGLVAWRYGFIPDGDNNPDRLSFVELEHRHAWDRKLPTLIFLASEDAEWPSRFIDRGPSAEQQQQFRASIMRRVQVDFFVSPQDLADRVIAAVLRWQSQGAPQTRAEAAAPSAASLELPPGVDPFELAWRLVVQRSADPALLRHMDLDQLKKAVEAWARDSAATPSASPESAGRDRGKVGEFIEDVPVSAETYLAAQQQLAQKQANLSPHPLWLAWISTTRPSLQQNQTPPPRHA